MGSSGGMETLRPVAVVSSTVHHCQCQCQCPISGHLSDTRVTMTNRPAQTLDIQRYVDVISSVKKYCNISPSHIL